MQGLYYRPLRHQKLLLSFSKVKPNCQFYGLFHSSVELEPCPLSNDKQTHQFFFTFLSVSQILPLFLFCKSWFSAFIVWNRRIAQTVKKAAHTRSLCCWGVKVSPSSLFGKSVEANSGKVYFLCVFKLWSAGSLKRKDHYFVDILHCIHKKKFLQRKKRSITQI